MQKDQYLIPPITNLLNQLGSTKVYTKLDLCAGYYNVCIAAGHEWKTAFRMCYGSFEFLVMLMDLPMLLCHVTPGEILTIDDPNHPGPNTNHTHQSPTGALGHPSPFQCSGLVPLLSSKYQPLFPRIVISHADSPLPNP